MPSLPRPVTRRLLGVLVLLASGAPALAAPPERVLQVLGDLSQWPALWDLDVAGDASRVHLRGQPQTPGQAFLWSSSERSRGRARLVRLEEDGVSYEVEWNHDPILGGGVRPRAHVGQITVSPQGTGSLVRWRVADPVSAESLPKQAARVDRARGVALDRLGPLALQGAGAAQPPAPKVQQADTVLLWGGFHHRWTYNHRINRSGDWWTVPACADGSCAAEQVHAAASGSGQDRATFQGFGSALAGPGLTARYGSVSLWLDGAEGEEIHDRGCVSLPADTPPGPVLLRGYDLDAVESADSLWGLSVAVSREGQQVCAEGTVRMDCRTPECGRERLTTYVLDVPFVVASGPDLKVEQQSLSQHQLWQANDLRDEPDPGTGLQHLDLTVLPDHAAAMGMSAFSITLDEALHTRGMDLALRPAAGGASADTLPVDVDLFYVQWGPVEIAPLTVAQFAHAGEATLTADLVLLQVPGGCTGTAQTSGSLFWPGKLADASVSTAEHRAEAAFDLPCLAGE